MTVAEWSYRQTRRPSAPHATDAARPCASRGARHRAPRSLPSGVAPRSARSRRRLGCQVRQAGLPAPAALWQPPPARRPGHRGTGAAKQGRRPARPPRPQAFDPEHLGHRLRFRPVGCVRGSRGGRQLGGIAWPMLASTCREPRSAAPALPQTVAWKLVACCIEALPESPTLQLSRRRRRRRRRCIEAPHPSQPLVRAHARRRRGLRAGRSML